ncbi:MAG: hypothetical protein WCP52_03060 [Bacteroidota bacterium]
MKKIGTIYLILVFVACSSSPKVEQESSQTVISLLKWYNANMSTIGRINMVNNNGNAVVDSTKLYSVNFDSTEKYLSALKVSGFFSEKYLQLWRTNFKQYDEEFKTTPQYDGPPEAFDYDLIMCSQEYDEDLKNLDKAKVISQKSEENTTKLVFQFPSQMKLEYTLTKNLNKWEIDEIKNVTNFADDYMKALNE